MFAISFHPFGSLPATESFLCCHAWASSLLNTSQPRLAFDNVAAAGWSACDCMGCWRSGQPPLHMAAASHLCLQCISGCPALQAAPLAGEEAPRDTAADSFVAALLQRASLSGREAQGMLLGEGGLDSVAAEQLRRDMEERVARASEGGMEPQQREGYGQEVGLWLVVCRPYAAGDVTAVAVTSSWGSASVLPQ